MYSSLGRYVVRRLRSSCTSSRRAARRSTSFQLSHFRCSTATPCVGLTHSYGYMLRSSSPGRARGSETCLPVRSERFFRYGVPGKGGIKEASAKPFHVVPAVRPALSSGRLLRSRFRRDSVADRPLRPGRRNGVRRRSQHMSFARESALTAGEQVILVQLRTPCYVRTQDVRRRNAACSSFCRYSSRYRGCVRRQDSLRVTSSSA